MGVLTFNTVAEREHLRKEEEQARSYLGKEHSWLGKSECKVLEQKSVCLHLVSCGSKKEGVGKEGGEISKDKDRMGRFPHTSVTTLAFPSGSLQTQVISAR